MPNKIENTLQITGKSTLSEPIEIEKEYIVEIRGTVNKKSIRSNEDGTFEHKFNLQQEFVSLIREGKKIKCKDKSKRSKKMRNAWWFIHDTEIDTRYKNMEFEEFYDYAMAITNSNLPEVWEILKRDFIKNG